MLSNLPKVTQLFCNRTSIQIKMFGLQKSQYISNCTSVETGIVERKVSREENLKGAEWFLDENH